ncbi:MAG: hypothetical protein AAGA83_00265 [Cyanobacteria bacterium P01_F01_bin.116]
MTNREVLIKFIEILVRLNGKLSMRHLSLTLMILKKANDHEDILNKITIFLEGAAAVKQAKKEARATSAKKNTQRLEAHHENQNIKKMRAEIPF